VQYITTPLIFNSDLLFSLLQSKELSFNDYKVQFTFSLVFVTEINFYCLSLFSLFSFLLHNLHNFRNGILSCIFLCDAVVKCVQLPADAMYILS
jgi:hypothetical protein